MTLRVMTRTQKRTRALVGISDGRINPTTDKWSLFGEFEDIPYVDVPSPNGVIRFENKDGVIHANMLEEIA